MAERRSGISRRSFMALVCVPVVSAAGIAVAATGPDHGGASHRAFELSGRLTRSDASQRTFDDQRGFERPKTAFRTDTLNTSEFGMLALTWRADMSDESQLRFAYRTRGSSGWSRWRELEPDQHGPDSLSERRRARNGTSLVGVGSATALEVQVEAAETPPAELRAHVITLTDGPDPLLGSRPAGRSNSAAAGPMPTILTRADWGADESIRESGDPLYGEVRGMFVHHTAGINDYTSAEVPSIIDGIYRYHVEGRGWRDIGYNFLIDKFGRIWEGRYGGIDEAVIGAHTRGYNSYSFAAAILGNHVETAVSEAALRAYRDLIAWKFHANNVRALDSVEYPERTLPAISGHRDGGDTACPGQRLYDKLPQLRKDVATATIQPGSIPKLTGPVRSRS